MLTSTANRRTNRPGPGNRRGSDLRTGCSRLRLTDARLRYRPGPDNRRGSDLRTGWLRPSSHPRMSGHHAAGNTHTHTHTHTHTITRCLAKQHSYLPTLTLTGGTHSTPSLLLAVQQGVLDCRVHQPQASYLYQPIIVFCQYSVSHGIVHSSYYTIQYILE